MCIRDRCHVYPMKERCHRWDRRLVPTEEERGGLIEIGAVYGGRPTRCRYQLAAVSRRSEDDLGMEVLLVEILQQRRSIDLRHLIDEEHLDTLVPHRDHVLREVELRFVIRLVVGNSVPDLLHDEFLILPLSFRRWQVGHEHAHRLHPGRELLLEVLKWTL